MNSIVELHLLPTADGKWLGRIFREGKEEGTIAACSSPEQVKAKAAQQWTINYVLYPNPDNNNGQRDDHALQEPVDHDVLALAASITAALLTNSPFSAEARGRFLATAYCKLQGEDSRGFLELLASGRLPGIKSGSEK
jgi:hypothetical protein